MNSTMPPLLSGKEFDNYLEDIVGKENLYVNDAECISEPQDYIDIFHQLVALAKPAITVQNITVTNSANGLWPVMLELNNVTHSFTINGKTDWFDTDFVKNINQALRTSGSAYTFYQVDCYSRRQEMGYVYLHDSLAASICAFIQ